MRYLLLFFMLNASAWSIHAQTLDFQLIVASEQGDQKEVLSLLRKGANVNAVTDEGVSPLMYATDKGDLAMMKLLLEYGADPNRKPFNGINALMNACLNNNYEAVELLLQYRAKPDERDHNDYTPLMYAANYGHYAIADLLLYHGADASLKNKEADVMMIAAYEGDTALIRLLIHYKTDINSSDDKKITPLMIASQRGHLEAVKLLCENGAEINAKNALGRTALAVAAENGQDQVVKYLLEKESDATVRDEKGLTARDLAKLKGYRNTAQLIEKQDFISPVKPWFTAMNAGFNQWFNGHDYMMGFVWGFYEGLSGLNVSMTFQFRPHRNAILQKTDDNTYYQFRERRSNLGIELVKTFMLTRTQNSSVAAYAGAGIQYSYGSYKAVRRRPDDAFLFSPTAGIQFRGKSSGLTLGYRYLNYRTPESAPHLFTLGLNLYFPLKTLPSSNKYLYWF